MDEDTVLRLQISLVYANARIDALQEALAECLPELHGQSLDSWVDNRQGELVHDGLCRIEDANPARSANAQALIDQTRAKLATKRPPQE